VKQHRTDALTAILDELEDFTIDLNTYYDVFSG